MASVRRCIDCDVMLTDDVAASPSADAAVATPVEVGDGERVAYELEGWGNQLKVSLEGMLDNAGIRRVWEVGALVVSARDAAAVADLIATVEGRDVEALADVEEQLAFEIEGLDAEGAAELDARLIAAGIVHAWTEDGELLVALDDEDRVTAIVEAVVEGEGADDEADGLVANQVLSDMYVALDRLVKSPEDQKLVARFVEAAGALEALGVPYGFAAQEWADLKQEAATVVAMAGAGPASNEEAAPDRRAAGEETSDGEAKEEEVERDGVGDEDLFRTAAGDLRERLLGWV